MKIEELTAFLEEHKSDPNYQYKDRSWEQIDAMALQSFSRLPADQKTKVLKVCNQYGLTDPHLIIRARFIAQTNLFALCRLLGYQDVSRKEYVWIDGTTHNTHEEVCNDFFAHKDPTFPTFKQYAMKYLGKKERLLLIPRGCFKSTIDMADCVQWVINFPEVTILILTGILNLAKDFVGEIKSHFTLEDADSAYADLFAIKKNLKVRSLHGEPSIFQMLFAEHCVPEDEGKACEYQTPASTVIQKESTIFAASIEQSLTGWHVCIMKLDDVVTNENSLTVDRLKGVNKQVSINKAMKHPYGFFDKIGTWYDTEDTYGQDIKDSKKAAESGEDFPMKIYIRAAWWPNETARKAGKIEEEMTKADYDLLFGDPENPHALTYERLKQEKRDPYFAIKYLNDPTQMHNVKFPRELLVRRTIHANLLPGTGMIVSTVDTAYSTKSWADYTVIVTALIYGGRFYIIDMQRGRYNEFELPAIIAGVALKWKPKRICIEESVGVKWLGREIYREMDKLKVRSPIEFVPLGVGNNKTNSKMIKAKPVLRFLGDERLLISNSCPNLDELYEELERFGTAASTHDDIVDALAILVNQFAGYADMEAKWTAQQSDFIPNPKERIFYEQTYCVGKYAVQEMALDNPETSEQDLMKQAQMDNVSNGDPLADLW